MSLLNYEAMQRKLIQSLSVVILLVLATFLYSCAKDSSVTAPEQTPQKISGVIVDEDGNSVANTPVDILNDKSQTIKTTNTDEEGGFHVDISLDQRPALLRVHSDFHKNSPIDLLNLIRNAGGNSGLIVTSEHDDSCCGVLNVTLTSGGSALANVAVALRHGTTTITTAHTDSTGVAHFTHVCAGSYNVRAAKDGYSVYEHDVTFEHCDSAGLSASLEHNSTGGGSDHDTCCSGVLTIVPHDSATSAVITGASVRLTRTGMTTRNATTDANGITFHELCSGQYNIRIAKDGYRVIEYSITISCNATTSDSRTMASTSSNHGSDDSCCHGVITINVHDSATSAALGGATVQISKDGHVLASHGTEQGTIGFDGLCAGQYTVTITKDGYNRQEFTVTLGCNGHETASRNLGAVHHSNQDSCCSGNIVLHVRDSSSNAAISGVSARLYRGSTNAATMTTNGDGTIRFTNVCQGDNLSISLSKDGYHGTEFSFRIGCNDTIEINKKLLSNTTTHNDSCCTGVLRVNVTDQSSGSGLNGATVTIRKSDVQIASGTTSDSHWTTEHLCSPATYVIVVTKDGYHSRTQTVSFSECNTQTVSVTLEHN